MFTGWEYPWVLISVHRGVPPIQRWFQGITLKWMLNYRGHFSIRSRRTLDSYFLIFESEALCRCISAAVCTGFQALACSSLKPTQCGLSLCHWCRQLSSSLWWLCSWDTSDQTPGSLPSMQQSLASPPSPSPPYFQSKMFQWSYLYCNCLYTNILPSMFINLNKLFVVFNRYSSGAWAWRKLLSMVLVCICITHHCCSGLWRRL